MNLSKPECDFTPIETLLMEAIASRVLIESVKMKLYDKLESPKTLSEISVSVQASEEGMEVFLNLLEARGLVVKSGDFYSNSLLAAEFLLSSSFFYQGDLLRLKQGFSELVNENLLLLLQKPGCVREKIDQKVSPADYFKGVEQYTVQGDLQSLVEFVTVQDGFSEMRTMCDLGGNHGRYSMALLEQNPELTVELLDLPKITPLSEKAVCKAGYKGRIDVKNFDLRTDELVPQAYDLVLVSHVLQMFVDNLENVIAKIGRSIKIGGLFVSQNRNPDIKTDQKLKTCTDLLSRLLAQANHFIPRADLVAALTHAGFVDIQMQVGGPDDANLMVVARKDHEGTK